MQGMWVWSLVGDLRFHMPCGHKNQNTIWKQYSNKIDKDLKKIINSKNQISLLTYFNPPVLLGKSINTQGQQALNILASAIFSPLISHHCPPLLSLQGLNINYSPNLGHWLTQGSTDVGREGCFAQDFKTLSIFTQPVLPAVLWLSPGSCPFLLATRLPEAAFFFLPRFKHSPYQRI